MTETEARHFVQRVQDLCMEYQRDCGCKIEFKIHEEYKDAKKVEFIIIDSISLKVDKWAK